MLDMLRHSMVLFLQGRLFRDNRAVFTQWGIGFVVSLLLIALLGTVNPWLGAIVGGLAGGAAGTWLFRDLKYN